MDYQSKLNPDKFTLVGWIKPNNTSFTMEGILSSEYGKTGYGLYRWIYRSYRTTTSPTVNSVGNHDLYNRDGSTIKNATGTCDEVRYRPSTAGLGAGFCDTYNLSTPPNVQTGIIIISLLGQIMDPMRILRP